MNNRMLKLLITSFSILAIAFSLIVSPAYGIELGWGREDGGKPGAYLSWGAGARSLSMGKAFAGLADDASATYWNPAGLAQLQQKELTSLYSILWEDTSYSFLSYAHPLSTYESPSNYGTIGVAVVNLRSTGFQKTDDLNRDIGTASDTETAGIISYGRKVTDNLMGGMNLKIVNQHIDNYSDMGYGLDIGLLYKPYRRWSMGMNLRNLIPPSLKLKKSTDRFPLELRFGLAYRIFVERLTMAIDGDKTEGRYFKLHYGVEFLPHKVLALRMGVDETEVAAGLGFRLKNLQVDYAYAYHDAWGKYSDLGSSHRIGLSVRFGKKEVAEVTAVREEPVGVSSESVTSEPARPPEREEYGVLPEGEIGVLPKGREISEAELARSLPSPLRGEGGGEGEIHPEEKPERPLMKAEVEVEIAPFEKIDRVDEKHYLTAESCFAQGDYTSAIREYELVISSSPQSELVGSASLRKAECYYNLKNYGEALNLFNQIWETSRDSFLAPEILYGLSQCHLRQGKVEEAKSVLERLIGSFPGYLQEGRVNYSLGLIHYYQGEYGQALESFGKVDSVYASYYQARCLEELGRELPGQAKYNEILEKYPESELADDALYGIGEAFYRMGQYDFAMRKFWDFLKSYPESELAPYARFMIGASRFNEKDYSKAIENCQIFFRQYPRSELVTSVQYLTAESLKGLGRNGEAIENYRVIIGSFTSSGLARLSQYKLAYLYASMGEYNRSLEEGEKFLGVFLKGRETPSPVSSSLMGEGEGEIRRGEPYEHPTIDEAWKDILLLKGFCLQKLGRYSEAETTYQSAFNIVPDGEVGGKALYLLGLTYYEQGDYDSLITSYKNLVSGISSPPGGWLAGAYYYIGEAYYQLGRYKEAEEMYSYVLEKYPGWEMAKYAKSGLVACATEEGNFDLALTRNREFLECYGEGDKNVAKTASLQVANLYFNKRDYENSLLLYRRFVEEYPDDETVGEALYRQGLAFYRLGHYSEAIKTWKTILDKKRGGKVALQALDRAAYTSFGLGNYDEAIKVYRKLLTEFPATEQAREAQLHIAESYYNSKQYEKAVQEYEKFMKSYPEDSRKGQALEGIKLSYYEKASREGSSDEGLESFVQRYSGESLAGEAYWQLGVKNFERREYIKAINNFQEVVLDYPHVPSCKLASYYLGEAYYALKNFAEAIEAFQNFLSSYPEDELVESARFHLANGLFQAGQIKDSIDQYRQIFELYPDSRFSSQARLNIALAYKKLNEWKKAVEEYKNFIQQNPDGEKANFAKWQIGEISRNNGDYRQATEFYQRVEPTKEITECEIRYRVADCYECLGEMEEATGEYQTLKELPAKSDPFRLAGLLRLAEIYEKQGRNGEAVTIYTEINNSTDDEKWKSLAEVKLKELKP